MRPPASAASTTMRGDRTPSLRRSASTVPPRPSAGRNQRPGQPAEVEPRDGDVCVPRAAAQAQLGRQALCVGAELEAGQHDRVPERQPRAVAQRPGRLRIGDAKRVDVQRPSFAGPPRAGEIHAQRLRRRDRRVHGDVARPGRVHRHHRRPQRLSAERQRRRARIDIEGLGHAEVRESRPRRSAPARASRPGPAPGIAPSRAATAPPASRRRRRPAVRCRPSRSAASRSRASARGWWRPDRRPPPTPAPRPRHRSGRRPSPAPHREATRARLRVRGGPARRRRARASRRPPRIVTAASAATRSSLRLALPCIDSSAT